MGWPEKKEEGDIIPNSFPPGTLPEWRGEGGEGGGGGQREKVSKVWDSPDKTDLFQESLNSCCIVLNRQTFFLSNYELIVCRIPPLVPSVSILRPLFMG